MTALTWDNTGERLYETGVDHGVLYPRDSDGVYSLGVAWNGLTTITESPAGADATPTYADNIKYLNLISVETFDATINAYTYPDEWAACDGSEEPVSGVMVGQQSRQTFGLCYRTRIGNDIDGTDHGYKLHLVYGATAKPSQKAYASINDQPSAIDFGWDITTIPVAVTGLKPTASMTIDSTKVDAGNLADLELILYGTTGVDPRLPLPDEVITIMTSGLTNVDLAAAGHYPTYNTGTHTVTYPASFTGVTNWTQVIQTIDGSGNVTGTVSTTTKAAAATTVLSSGQRAVITPNVADGYTPVGDDEWVFDY